MNFLLIKIFSNSNFIAVAVKAYFFLQVWQEGISCLKPNKLADPHVCAIGAFMGVPLLFFALTFAAHHIFFCWVRYSFCFKFFCHHILELERLTNYQLYQIILFFRFSFFVVWCAAVLTGPLTWIFWWFILFSLNLCKLFFFIILLYYFLFKFFLIFISFISLYYILYL